MIPEKKKSLEPPGTSSGGFGNSNLKACAMAVLDFVINLFSSQCDFHEDFFFGRTEKFWETLKFTPHPGSSISKKPLLTQSNTCFRPPGRSEELHLFILKAECIAKSGDQILGSACPLSCPGRKFADALVVNELAMAIKWSRGDSIYDFVNSFRL